MLEKNKVYCGNWIDLMNQLDDLSINMSISSPPYWGLRDYQVKGQIGLEKHPKEFIKTLVSGFAILKKKLRKDGSFYLNMGDTYYGSSCGKNDYRSNDKRSMSNPKLYTNKPSPQSTGRKSNWLQPKQLMLMPLRLAIAMQEDGWILRNDIIWHKPNPMPSSVKDRLNTTYEHIFHFVKSKKYYYDLDAIRVPNSTHENRPMGIIRERGYPNAKRNKFSSNYKVKNTKHEIGINRYENDSYNDSMHKNGYNNGGKNPGDFFSINTQPFSEAHFATFPEAICVNPILSSCPLQVCKKCGKARVRITKPTKEYAKYLGTWTKDTDKSKKLRDKIGFQAHTKKVAVTAQYTTVGFTDCGCKAGFEPGIVLDPFAGSGTACLVAKNLGRNYMGFDLNKEYCILARKRIAGWKNKDFKEERKHKSLKKF